MNSQAIELIEKQLNELKVSELKTVCRVLRQKKPFKYSKLNRSDMIREITNFLDFSSALNGQFEKMRKSDNRRKEKKDEEGIIKRMNELVEITSRKRLRDEDVLREKEEYLRLRELLMQQG
jgi:hypothetical protein